VVKQLTRCVQGGFPFDKYDAKRLFRNAEFALDRCTSLHNTSKKSYFVHKVWSRALMYYERKLVILRETVGGG
jgi:hypothetical protein